MFFDFTHVVSALCGADLWSLQIQYTVVGCSIIYMLAGLLFARVLRKGFVSFLVIPCFFSAWGVAMGFLTGSVISLFIAAIYVSIPYSIPSEICAGFGLMQAVVIAYFDLGRASQGESLRVL